MSWKFPDQVTNNSKLKVDCHTHTFFSGDSSTTLEEFEEAVFRSGIDIICVTDHSTIKGALRLQARDNINVVVGQECKTSNGEIIGLFLTKNIESGLSPIDVAKSIRDQGGFVSIPHPFDPFRNCLNEKHLFELLNLGLVDGIETFNSKSSSHQARERARLVKEEYNIAEIGGSDSHVPESIGSAYITVDIFTNKKEFIKVLKDATVTGEYFDPPRPWSKRIIPSVKQSCES